MQVFFASTCVRIVRYIVSKQFLQGTGGDERSLRGAFPSPCYNMILQCDSSNVLDFWGDGSTNVLLVPGYGGKPPTMHQDQCGTLTFPMIKGT